MIYFFDYSAASLSLFLTRRLDAITTIIFVLVQFFGAFLGAVIFRALVSEVIFEDYFVGTYVTGDGRDGVTKSQGFFLEIILSSAVCFSYICTSDNSELIISFCWKITHL
ncbi:hypothetical protein DICVIV_03302 [Dictyocaulus viviparus]|uniref:Uncharacterized protein n=1 Tax=Dictyocaulus viviparus TaxID=29172 RepID=A0A0D8Y2Y2_DICVI|nr:hypothetical protein DICVIV_03302 [Dictyocaulus viviparus]